MRLLSIIAGVFLASSVLADEASIELKPATGKDVVEANCGACHSLDYVVMNSPFLDRPKWEATVKKMIGAFGAPVEDRDVATIVEYLVANYATK